MNIEKDVFKRNIIDFNKLKEYGFEKKETSFLYSKKILNGSFKVDIFIDLNGNVDGKIYDLDTNEEYTNFRIDSLSGNFVSQVREEYINVLNDIKEKCCKSEYFIYKQSNRIADYIYDRYKVKPEFLWDNTPGCGVFRNKRNNKWFGIIMNIDESKINSNHGEVEVINVKINENNLDDYLLINGIYKAYHMNKKSWITIILNDTLDDNIITSLIDESFDLVNN
jgi:predicted DNA-binding protein (MmcQ/YjbR family)